MKDMIRKRNMKPLSLSLLAAACLMNLPSPASASVKGSYLYNLSGFTGTIPYGWSVISADNWQHEIYVSYQDIVGVFNNRGMEIYHFGEDADFGIIQDVAVDKDGTIYVLSYSYTASTVVTVCNYRGEPVSTLELKNLPDPFRKIYPSRIFLTQDGLLYLASSVGMKVVVVDTQGNFKDGYDIAALLSMTEQEVSDTGITGFSIDKDKNLLFTIGVWARAYIVTADRRLKSFGRRGSSPGKFGVPSGIVRDNHGNYVVTDTLRCVIMVFDENFKFLTEFGGRGLGRGRLIGPKNLAVDDTDKVYVSQLRNRGVSVFQLNYE